MLFGSAIDALVRHGRPVARRAWPEGTWLTRCEPTDVSAHTRPIIVMDRPPLAPDQLAGDRVPYAPSHDDMLSEDWIVVE